VATNIIIYSETGICTLRQLMNEEGYDKAYRAEKIDDLFMTYISALITRTEVAEITSLGLSDGLSTPEYYFAGLLLFFMLLLSFCAISFFLGGNDSRYKFMSAKGLSAPWQVVGEYIPFFTINLICAGITIGLLGILTYKEVIELQVDIVSIAAKLIPVCIMFSALGFMIFEILIGVINKILVAFMLYIGMGYVSGYFYPKTFFPDIVQKIGEMIPSGVAFQYLGAVLQRESERQYLLIMLGYTVVFIGASMLVRQQKIR
jgi:ABC-2 type transport system permease protein